MLDPRVVPSTPPPFFPRRIPLPDLSIIRLPCERPHRDDPVYAAVTFVAAGTSASAASGDVAPGLPAGWAADDIHVCVVEAADNVVCTFPAGWTKKLEQNSGVNQRVTIAWRRAVAGDTAPTVTHTAGADVAARIAGFRGAVTSGDPFDAAASQANSGLSSTITAPAITPLNANDMILFIGGQTDGVASTYSAYSGTNPTFSEAYQFNVTPNANNIATFFAYGLKTDTTTTGTRTATSSEGTSASVGALLAMQAAGAAARHVRAPIVVSQARQAAVA